MSKYILNEDGRLYLDVHLMITTSRGHVHKGRRTGNAYSTNVARDFESMKQNAVYDAYYQFKKENGLNINYSDDIEYEILDYDVDYNYSELKSSIYKRKVVNRDSGRKVQTYRRGKYVKTETYETKTRDELNKKQKTQKLSREQQRRLNQERKER